MEEAKVIIIKWIKEVTPYILIILAVLLVRKYIITPVRVNGTSMEPTLLNGEVLVLEKMNNNYERFDIVVLNANGERLVKRIIGLPGEHIEYYDNKLFIDNKIIKNKVTNYETYDFYLEELGIDIIPEGYYFVLGDNRENSVDSRYIGLISDQDILGTVRFRFYPFNKIGDID